MVMKELVQQAYSICNLIYMRGAIDKDGDEINDEELVEICGEILERMKIITGEVVHKELLDFTKKMKRACCGCW